MIILLIYSVVARFITSLYSIRFDKHVMEVDGACFFDVGKAIFDGKILYKEVFDHKTPYIYFINGIASLIDFNHIGLFIIEVLVLFISIYFIYKFLHLYFENTFLERSNLDIINLLSMIGSFFMATIFSLRNISFGYSRTESFAVAFLMIANYISYRYFFVETDIKEQKNKMFIIGLLAGLTFMTNIKAAILFVPIAISVLIINVKKKNYKLIVRHFVLGLAGVVVSVLPYIIYVILTDSFLDMKYALIDTNLAYARSKVAMDVVRADGILHYDPKDGVIATIMAFTVMNPITMILIYISFIPMLIFKYNPYLKLTVVLQYVFAFLYIMLGGRLHTYYIYIMLPSVLFLYIFVVHIVMRYVKKNTSTIKSGQNNIDDEKISNDYLIKTKVKNKLYAIILLSSAILTILISAFINVPTLNKLVYNHISRSTRMQKIVSSYKNYTDDIKVLAVGFSPEVYVYLDADIKYKYFITPSISYKEDRTGYIAQYNYIAKNDPDIIVISEYQSLHGFPNDLKNQIMYILSTSYSLLGEVTTNANDGSYFIYSKN